MTRSRRRWASRRWGVAARAFRFSGGAASPGDGATAGAGFTAQVQAEGWALVDRVAGRGPSSPSGVPAGRVGRARDRAHRRVGHHQRPRHEGGAAAPLPRAVQFLLRRRPRRGPPARRRARGGDPRGPLRHPGLLARARRHAATTTARRSPSSPPAASPTTTAPASPPASRASSARPSRTDAVDGESPARSAARRARPRAALRVVQRVVGDRAGRRAAPRRPDPAWASPPATDPRRRAVEATRTEGTSPRIAGDDEEPPRRPSLPRPRSCPAKACRIPARPARVARRSSAVARVVSPRRRRKARAGCAQRERPRHVSSAIPGR